MGDNLPSASLPKRKVDAAALREAYSIVALMRLTGYSRWHCNRILAGAAPLPAALASIIARDMDRPLADLLDLTLLQPATLDATALHAALDAATATQTIQEFVAAAGITLTVFNNARHHPGDGITLKTALRLARHFNLPVESLITLKESPRDA